MKVLFDYHTVPAQPYSGKFNMVRFAECLALDDSFRIHMVFDRQEGPVPQRANLTHEFLRKRRLGYVVSAYQLSMLWLARLKRAEYDVLYTEVVLPYGQSLLHFLQNPRKGALFIDFQDQDLVRLSQNLLRRMRQYRAFHVLTPRQGRVLQRMGFPGDRIFSMPNCVNLESFKVTPTFKERLGLEEPLALYVYCDRDPLAPWLGQFPPGTLVTVGCPYEIPGALRLSRLPWDQYVDLLRSADLAISLTPQRHAGVTRMFEFAACGLPFAAPYSPAMEELLPSGRYGLSTDEWYGESLPAQVRELMEDSSRSRLGASLLKEVAAFTYEATLPRMRRMMEVVCC